MIKKTSYAMTMDDKKCDFAEREEVGRKINCNDN